MPGGSLSTPAAGTGRFAVIGAGLSGLAAAHHLRRLRPEADLHVLDGADRVGGMIETIRDDGCVIERGPEGVVSTKPEALELIHELGLDDRLLIDGPAPRRSFIVRGGELRPLPYGILDPTRSTVRHFLTSPLLSWRGRLRILAEPFVRRRTDPTDESVAGFVTRRFGSELLDELIGPLVAGIHGGDADLLSARMVLPAFHRLEQQGSSVVIAAARTSPAQRALPPLVSLRPGMDILTETLAETLGAAVELGSRVTRLDLGDQIVVHRDGGASLDLDGVVLAVPGHLAADLLRPHHDRLADALASLPATDSQTVTIRWSVADVDHPMEGTGFIVPAGEGRRLAACTWIGAKWHDRVPDDTVMVRCFLRAPGASDEELVAIAIEELGDLMGITAPPQRVYPWQTRRALPVSALGHADRVAEIHRLAGGLGRVALAGAGLEGAGLPACIVSGRRAAEAVAAPDANSGIRWPA